MVSLGRRAYVASWLFGLVGAQTFYHVSESGQPTTEVISQTVSISAAGVGADGATTYVENIVESYIAIEYSDTTVTLLTSAHPYAVTLVVDASGYHLSAPFQTGVVLETCGFGADSLGTCVEKLPFGSSTQTKTRSGAAVPFYTLAAATATTPAPMATSASPNAATLPVPSVLWRIVSCAFALFINML